MGQSMCALLIRAGFTLTVFNRTTSKAQPLLDLEAHLAHSPHAAASRSDAVFSIVSYPFGVRSVHLDPTYGALAGLRPSGILVDMTTSDPSLAVEIAVAATSKGCHSVDAPVSGGDRGAKDGTLSISLAARTRGKETRALVLSDGEGDLHGWEREGAVCKAGKSDNGRIDHGGAGGRDGVRAQGGARCGTLP